MNPSRLNYAQGIAKRFCMTVKSAFAISGVTEFREHVKGEYYETGIGTLHSWGV